jgi:class 3 adenylate cyclase
MTISYVAKANLCWSAAMELSSESRALFAILREAAKPASVDAIEAEVREAPDRSLCRINALSFAREHGLDEEEAIAAFLHASRLGIFELFWNVLCPGCGGVLETGASLKVVDQSEYSCSLCAAGFEPTLDEMVEVTFTVSARVRRIAAHDPHRLPTKEYYRQVFWGSGVDLPPDEAYERFFDNSVLEALELPAGEKAIVSLNLPAEFIIVFDPVVHSTQFLDVKGEPTRERQSLTIVLTKEHAPTGTMEIRPGPIRILFENRSGERTLPGVWIAGDELHELLGRRRPFVTAKRLLTNQTFRDIYRTDTLDIDQRLKITSLTFLFTDLKGSTALYDRVGDLAAYDLVKAHFAVLHRIVASQAGAVVKTIGDAVMATFPTPDRAVAAALRMRDEMRELSQDLLLKIGIHEGPCIAVTLNERQDYFGQTVNIASRVQALAKSRSILATGSIVKHADAAKLLHTNGISPLPTEQLLQGITDRMPVFEIP